MKTKFAITAVFFFIITLFSTAHSQGFRKHSFLISLSEGSTRSSFSTHSETAGNSFSHHEYIHGARDPICLEFGLSDHWGIGISVGNDIFTINPNKFYHTDALPAEVKATSDEFTINTTYHFSISKKTDVSAAVSLGSSSMTIKGTNQDQSNFQYMAKGNIIRLGLHGRYYIFKHVGVLCMLTTYVSNCSPKEVKGNTFGYNVRTSTNGFADRLSVPVSGLENNFQEQRHK